MTTRERTIYIRHPASNGEGGRKAERRKRKLEKARQTSNPEKLSGRLSNGRGGGSLLGTRTATSNAGSRRERVVEAERKRLAQPPLHLKRTAAPRGGGRQPKFPLILFPVTAVRCLIRKPRECAPVSLGKKSPRMATGGAGKKCGSARLRGRDRFVKADSGLSGLAKSVQFFRKEIGAINNRCRGQCRCSRRPVGDAGSGRPIAKRRTDPRFAQRSGSRRDALPRVQFHRARAF